MKKKSLRYGLMVTLAVCFGLVLSANADTAGYWRFDGGTNGDAIVTAADSSGNGLTGAQWSSNEKNALYSSDKVAAYIYDPVTATTNANVGSMLAPASTNAADDCQVVVDHDLSVLDGSWTLEMFVKVLDNGGAADFAASKANRIFNLDGTATCNGDVGSSSGGSTLLKFRLDSTIFDYSSNFEDETWHHLAYVADYDGSNTTFTLYYDYESQGSDSYAGKFTGNAAGDLRFGVSSSSLSDFDWFLDDVRLSDTALATNQFLHAVAAPEPEPVSTVGYWRFDEGTNGNAIVTATDSSGNGLTGTQWSSNEKDALYSSDKVSAYIYDPVTATTNVNTGSMLSPASTNAADDCQVVVDQDLSILDGSWTLEMFVKVEDGGGAADFGASKVNRIFNLDGSATCNGHVSSSSGGSTLLQFRLNSTISDYSSNFEDETWHHLAYVANYDGSNTTFTLYYDYESQGSDTYAGKFTGNAAGDLRFGVSSSSLSDFDWFLDDVRLSDAALATNQFLQAVAEPEPEPVSTVGYWRFDEGTNGNAIVTATDSSGNGLTGAQWSSNEKDALYSSDKVAAYIYDPVTATTNVNTGSMLAPASTNAADDCQVVVDHDLSVLDGSWTLEMFVKVEDNSGPATFGASKANRLFNLDGSTSCNGTVGSTSGGTTTLKFRLGSEVTDYSSNFQDETWHHLAYVADYDGTNTAFKLYRDSVKVIDSTYAGKFTGNAAGDLRFGVSSSSLSNFDWFLDDVRLSDAALTTNEFLQAVEGAVALEPPTINFATSAGGLITISWSSTIGAVDSFTVLTNADLTNPTGWGDAGLSAYDDGAGSFVVTNVIGDETVLFYKLESN